MSSTSPSSTTTSVLASLVRKLATYLRRRRPHVPIIILSATLDRSFGGVEDMHLLKGYSSVDDLLDALSSLEAKRRGAPVVVDARDFYYSRISLTIGSDVLVQIFDEHGVWLYCNDAAADYLGQPRDWFPGRCVFDEMPTLMRDWREVLQTVCPQPRDLHRPHPPRPAHYSARRTSRTSPGAFSPSPSPSTTTAAESVLTARILDRSPAFYV